MSQPSLPALLCISSAAILACPFRFRQQPSLAAPFVSVSSHPQPPSFVSVSSHLWPPSLRLVSSRPWLLPCLVAAIYGCKHASNRAAKIQIIPNTTKYSLLFFHPRPRRQPSMAAKNRQPPRRTPPSGRRHH